MVKISVLIIFKEWQKLNGNFKIFFCLDLCNSAMFYCFFLGGGGDLSCVDKDSNSSEDNRKKAVNNHNSRIIKFYKAKKYLTKMTKGEKK